MLVNLVAKKLLARVGKIEKPGFRQALHIRLFTTD